jgi:hypothetical protein
MPGREEVRLGERLGGQLLEPRPLVHPAEKLVERRLGLERRQVGPDAVGLGGGK